MHPPLRIFRQKAVRWYWRHFGCNRYGHQQGAESGVCHRCRFIGENLPLSFVCFAFTQGVGQVSGGGPSWLNVRVVEVRGLTGGGGIDGHQDYLSARWRAEILHPMCWSFNCPKCQPNLGWIGSD